LRTLSLVARWLAAVVLVLVLVQAVMAGRVMSGDWTITAHGVLGNVTWTVQLVCVGIVVLARSGRAAIIVASVLAVLLSLQIGLGYLTRNSIEAVAWHVPLGVAIFGLAVHQLNVAAPAQRR
jgi:hypothetical protein